MARFAIRFVLVALLNIKINIRETDVYDLTYKFSGSRSSAKDFHTFLQSYHANFSKRRPLTAIFITFHCRTNHPPTLTRRYHTFEVPFSSGRTRFEWLAFSSTHPAKGRMLDSDYF
jgi:hypothetical protein